MANNFIDSFMEYTSNAQCPEQYLMWAAFSVVAGALERKVWLMKDHTVFYPNFYIMLIGDAGTRKSTSADIAVDLLRQVPGMHFLPVRLNEASMMTSLMRIGLKKKVNFGGKEYQHSAGFLYASEAVTAFKEMYHGGSIIHPLTDLYNCGDPGWNDTVGWGRETMKDGMTVLFNPCVNVLACSTATWFTENVMSKSSAEGGFGSRTLLVVEKDNYEQSFGWEDQNFKNHEMKMLLVKELTRINKLKGAFTAVREFKDVHTEYSKEVHEFMRNSTISDLLVGYYKRKMIHVTKLSMLISASEGDSLFLTERHLQKAWKLITGLEESMLKAYKAVGRPESKVEQDILKYLKYMNMTSFTKAGVVRAFKDKYDPRIVASSLDNMMRTGTLSLRLEGIGLKEPAFNLNLASLQEQ